MPIEIREIIIKTEISTIDRNHSAGVKEKDLNIIKKQLLEECKRIIAESVRNSNNKR
jgi:hypothetical protein